MITAIVVTVATMVCYQHYCDDCEIVVAIATIVVVNTENCYWDCGVYSV